MRLRPLFWFLVSVVCFVGAFYFWRLGNEWKAEGAKRPSPEIASTNSATRRPSALGASGVQSSSSSPIALLPLVQANTKTASTNAAKANPRLKYRLTNSTQTPAQLGRSDSAILLVNALIDSSRPLNLGIPDSLRSKDDPGAYIVQSRGPVDDLFRARLKGAGVEIVAYIPNNAYLVRASAAKAQQMGALPGIRTVLPFEPYYKLDSRLLVSAVEKQSLPSGTALNVVLFPDARTETLEDLEKLGSKVVKETGSPFGPILTVIPGADDLTALASLTGVQAIEVASKRTAANDLSRPRMGVAMDSIVPTNYMSLSGSNVLVNVNDSGIDSTHPDLTGRVFGPAVDNDTEGHGTHVAGIIAGDGTESTTVINASGSIMPPVAGQFRGMAPSASIFSLDFQGTNSSDLELQEAAARTNALISNNSWTYDNSEYDIAAASYDAAVRDALPDTAGSQPLVFVFAAGNTGNGSDGGAGVSGDTIASPATAKNVITVGSVEQFRNITNEVEKVTGESTNTTTPWVGMTDSDNEVAWFSSRGNSGVGVEGDFGRFKPDVVAPGSFVVSAKSAQFDETNYYNPSFGFTDSFIDRVLPGEVQGYVLFVPENAIDLTITVRAISPDVPLPIYTNPSELPTATNSTLVGTNTYTLSGGTMPSILFYGIGNPTNEAVQFHVTTVYHTTNELGNYFEVLKDVNSDLGPYYRYESGTSMSAAGVSGVLALMEDYFTNTLKLAPSPALMKALLINGARTVNAQYDLEVKHTLNDQGWGLVNLTNSLPMGITNQVAINTKASMFFFDQNPTNALATGDSRTVNVSVDPAAGNRPLRVTLVWTDPPGNPTAGIKLVNDLDLIVTNLDNPAEPIVYVGNDIPVGSSFNFAVESNAVPVFDNVNNVENVYLPDPLGTNYSVTVVGHRVNVNAVTAHTNGVVQDYALVISSGNGETNALTLVQDFGNLAFNTTNLTVITNDFGSVTNVSGQLLTGQRVGANSPLLDNNTVVLDTNTFWGNGGTNGAIKLGTASQWHFYIVTNTTSFTNAAFGTFQPPTLAIPRMGVTNYDNPDDATRLEADIDVFVSTDAGLLNLDPTAIAGADKSLRRGGSELVVYSNAVPNAVYYVGVHSEDQQAAEYSFFGLFSEEPFSDQNGMVRFLGLPANIPDGTPENPGGVILLGISTQPGTVRRVVLTNELSHENMGDLFGSLSHGQKSAVLNNHSFILNPGTGLPYTNYTYVYEDNDEQDIVGSQHTDGPGSLRNFISEDRFGVWLLTEVDSAPGSTGRVEYVSMMLDPEFDENGDALLNVAPNSYAFTSVVVPPEATNMTVLVINESTPTPLPVQLLIKRGSIPTLTDYDYTLLVEPGITNSLTISTNDFPPLQSGRYYIGIYNPNDVTQKIRIRVTLGLSLDEAQTVDFAAFGPQPILDDAVTYSSINVPYNRKIARVDVGLAIQHPRISDMAFTLISPQGKRILLFENRGAETADLGNVVINTNTVGTLTNGINNVASTNRISTGGPTSGILLINFDFQVLPDTLDVYYDGTNIFSSGLINGKGDLTIPFGPGTATELTIVINKDNNPGNPNTVWQYTPQIITQTGSYFRFSENTNFTQVPIKFAVPPFTNNAGATNIVLGPVVMTDDFETIVPGIFTAPGYMGAWAVASGDVEVLSGSAYSGSQFVNLSGTAGAGTIATNFSTVAGQEYQLDFSYSRNPDGVTNGTPAAMSVRVDGNTILPITADFTNAWANLDWQPASVLFTASSTNTLLEFQGLTGTSNGVLLDLVQVQQHSEVIGSTNYYFPEETLQSLVGDNAKGEWKLEMWDNRAGMTNAQMMSWQLRFIFEEEVPPAKRLVHDVPSTNTVAPCNMAYFLVDVPLWANYATNTLLFSTSPVNVYFSTNGLPTTNDVPQFLGVTSGVLTTLSTNSLPPITPGSRYYIAVENPCGSPSNATFAIQVEFDITTLQNGVAVGGTNNGNTLPRYFVYDVSTNATAVSFQLTNMTGNFDLVARQGAPLPTTGSYDYGSFNAGTQDESIVVFTNSSPVALAPGRWYLGVFTSSVIPAGYTIVATEYTNAFPNIITLQNGVPYTNSATAGGSDYYRYVVSGTGVRAQFEINSPTDDLTLVLRKGLPLPSITSYDYLSANAFTNDELIVLFTNSAPVPLTPGDWFLTAVNISGVPVDYSIKATEWASTGRPVNVTNSVYNPPTGTNVGSGSFCITWASLPGVHYYVEGVPDLSSTNWTAVSPTITATDYTTSHCVDLPSIYHFFRVVEGVVLSTFAPAPALSATWNGSAFVLEWSGAVGAQYQVEYSSSLSSPTWTAFASPVTTTTGVFTFTDDGSQTGGFGTQRFYRIVLLP